MTSDKIEVAQDWRGVMNDDWQSHLDDWSDELPSQVRIAVLKESIQFQMIGS